LFGFAGDRLELPWALKKNAEIFSGSLAITPRG